MKFIACIQLLSVVWSIDASVIADDNNGRVSSVRELQSEEPQQPTPAQLCGGAFAQLQFGIFNYDEYPAYFDESSVVAIAQAGVYTGPDAIKEYVKFADENSPYIEARRNYEGGNSAMTGFDPTTNICKFTKYFFGGLDLDPAMTAGNTINTGGIINAYYSAATNKVTTVHVYYTAPYLEEFFTQLQTRQVDDFVCDVLLGQGCLTELGDQAKPGLTKQKCRKRLSRLPVTEGEDHTFDGNSLSCRYLHTVFAATNTNHCAHISLIPAEDPKGNMKCQASANTAPDEYFSQTEIDGLYDLCGNQTSLGLDQDTCFHVIKNSDNDGEGCDGKNKKKCQRTPGCKFQKKKSGCVESNNPCHGYNKKKCIVQPAGCKFLKKQKKCVKDKNA